MEQRYTSNSTSTIRGKSVEYDFNLDLDRRRRVLRSPSSPAFLQNRTSSRSSGRRNRTSRKPSSLGTCWDATTPATSRSKPRAPWANSISMRRPRTPCRATPLSRCSTSSRSSAYRAISSTSCSTSRHRPIGTGRIADRPSSCRWASPPPFHTYPYPARLTAYLRQVTEARPFIGTGLYDALTTVGAVEHLLRNYPFPLDRVTTRRYDGGHMMYSDPQVSVALNDDLRAFLTNVG